MKRSGKVLSQVILNTEQQCLAIQTVSGVNGSNMFPKNAALKLTGYPSITVFFQNSDSNFAAAWKCFVSNSRSIVFLEDLDDS